ncbi:MAG: hypothetical protein ACPGR4_04885, partial [Paracoccaceae bacterium]
MKPPRSDDRKLAKWLKKICKTRKLPECIDPTDIRQYKLEDSIGIERCELKLAPLVESVLQPREA